MATYSFGFAHTDTITCIDVKPESNTEFASTSSDCEALMWDIRQSKPAQSIYSNTNIKIYLSLIFLLIFYKYNLFNY